MTPAERHLVLKAREDDAERARLIQSYMPRIGAVARRYRNTRGVELSELTQEGVVGILRALERYDPDIGAPFWPCAAWWVRQAIQRLVSERCAPIVLSDRALRQLARIRRAHERWVQERAREPTAADLAGATGIDQRQVQSLLAAVRAPRGFEDRAGDAGETGWSPGERLADPQADDAYERVDGALALEQLPELMAGLSTRERRVVRGRFGFEGRERTLRELAHELGLSAERVRQIEQEALGRMRGAA